MNCPTKDTNNSSVPGYYQNPSVLDNDLITNKTLNSSAQFDTLDQEQFAKGLGKSKEMTDNNSPDNTNGLSGPQGGSSSIKKKTSLRVDNTNSRNDVDSSANKSQSGERTPLCSSSSSQVSFGGTAHNDSLASFNSNAYQRHSRESDSHNSSYSQQGSPVSVLDRIKSFFNSNNGFAFLKSGSSGTPPGGNPSKPIDSRSRTQKIYKMVVKYLKFVGPGILVSSSFCDPGNYITGTAAGALYQYKLLFAILLSTFFAVFLQILCTKLGCVTGMDLAQNCRQHLPRWLNILIYVMAEIAIVATDLAEVVGTAIALNILFRIPLTFGVVLTIVDVLVVLMAYKPSGDMKIVRFFEYLVSALVLIVVGCFAVELGSISIPDKSEVFRGFLPSKELLETQGVYLFCGILGATVMPHSLYLGSGIVQPRLRDYDEKHGYFASPKSGNEEADEIVLLKYRPSVHAINYSLKYTIIELVVSLFTVALFVNSAILIVAGATLPNTPEAADADLYSIYNMLRNLLSPLAGTVFALALLFSGQSSGVVCTLAGQMVSEGFLHWSFKPWARRLITRSLSVIPCLIATLFIGRKGLAIVLTASQVVLSLLLPFVSAPLLYFTAKKSIMSVPANPPRVTNSSAANGAYSSTSTESDLADDTDVLVSAIASHSVDRYNSQRYRDASDEVSRGRASLEDGIGNSSVLTLTDPNGASHLGQETEHNGFAGSNDYNEATERSPLTSNVTNHGHDDDCSIAASSIVVPEYKDMSNSRLTNIVAFTIFILTTGINLFLILSAAFGADVHF